MKKLLPHLLALGLFIIIAMIYFAPLMSGKELRQSDINNWKGMAQEILSFKEKTGEQTYWTNSMFGGMPAYQIAYEYPGNIIKYIDRILTLGLPMPANYLFLFMAGFYFLLLVMRIDNRLAILGAIAYAFSTYFILFIVTGHNAKAHAIGYMAPVIGGIIMAYRGKTLLGVALTGLFLALELFTNHLQMTYYLLMMVVILVASEFYVAVREKRTPAFVKTSMLLGVAAVFAVMSNITNLWATQEYGKYSTRGPSELSADKDNQTSGLDRDYITDWSYGIGETFTLLIPDFKGGASEPIGRNNKDAVEKADPNFRQYITNFGSYYGDQPFTGGPVYVGSIIIMLFVAGLFIIKGPLKWWIVTATALSIMLSWGRHFMSLTNLFLDFVPGYDKFRAVTTTLVIAELTIPLLAVLVLNKLISEKNFFKEHKKTMLYSMGGVILFTMLVAASPGTFTNFYTEKEYSQVEESVKDQPNSQQLLDEFFSSVSAARKHIMVSDTVRSLLFLLISAILIWSFLRYQYKKEYLIYSLIILVFLDLVTVSKRYITEEDFVKKSNNVVPFPKTLANQIIEQDTSPSYRVLNVGANTWNEAATSYYHQSLGGYHGAKFKRYKELIDYNLMPELSTIRAIANRADSGAINIMFSQPGVNMMNAKYFIMKADQPPIENKGALGNAWFVRDMKIVANADSEIASINKFDPGRTVIIDQRFKEMLNGFSFNYDTTARILLKEYKPNHLTYESNAATEQLAVFSEVYYDKGWNAYIDGKLSDHFRANYVLRGMRIPAGKHTIEFKFEPQVIATGSKIAFAGALLIIGFIGLAGWKELRKVKAVNS